MIMESWNRRQLCSPWPPWPRKPVSAFSACSCSRGKAAWPPARSRAELGLAPATLSFHLKELAHAGLVTSRQDGRFIYYAADYAGMNRLLAFLTENCCAADGSACAPGTACVPVTKPRNTSRKVKR